MYLITSLSDGVLESQAAFKILGQLGVEWSEAPEDHAITATLDGNVSSIDIGFLCLSSEQHSEYILTFSY